MSGLVDIFKHSSNDKKEIIKKIKWMKKHLK